ncbi:MAG: MFS transporter [Pseudomonadota bacterium]
MSEPLSQDPVVDRTLRHSVKDGVAYSVMSGAGETYFSAFAIFLKASTSQIALLASLPPLIGSIAQLASAWLGRRTHRRQSIILGGAYAQIVVWAPMLLLPLLFPRWSVDLLLVCVIIYYAAGNLIAPQWSSMMGDLVPEDRRGRFFAMRTRLASITSFLAIVAAGSVLHYFAGQGNTYVGYAVLFLVAAAARTVSTFHLSRMYDPPGKVAALEMPSSQDWLQRITGAHAPRFSAYFALMMFAVNIASPFFTVYMLRDLHFTYLQFMVMTAASVVVQFLCLNTWGKIGDEYGNRVILMLTGALVPFLPLLWLVSQEFYYLLSLQILSGVAWAGFNLSAANFLYDLVPAPKRVTYLAMHNMMSNIAVFLGAMLGGLLATVLPAAVALGGYELRWFSPLLWVFLLSAIVRAAVAVMFLPHLVEVREVRETTMSAVVFRFIRFDSLSGLILEIVGYRRRP